MHAQDQKAIPAIAPQAAFADGTKDDREHAKIWRTADSLATELAAVDLCALYEADGSTTEAERQFLNTLKTCMGLGDTQAQDIECEVDPFIDPVGVPAAASEDGVQHWAGKNGGPHWRSCSGHRVFVCHQMIPNPLAHT